MKPKLQLLPPQRRLILAHKVQNLSTADKAKLIELIQLEIDGKLLGVMEGVSNTVYHHPLCPGFSSTDLKHAARSAVHYLLSSNFTTPQMEFGTAFHTILLEPKLFEAQYKVVNSTGTTVLGKGEKVLSSKEYYQLLTMLEALMSHKAAGSIFDPKIERRVEVTFFAVCPITGLLRKVRPDIYLIQRALVDVKTTGDASEEGFSDKADQYHYESQLAYYGDTLEIGGCRCPETYLWAVSRNETPDVIVFKYEEPVLKMGRARYMQGLENIAALMKRYSSVYDNQEIIRLKGGGL
ncbi:PD-(D/E)XK nuclease-like domain-containing protein [Bdellovibrio bacteriovorus]